MKTLVARAGVVIVASLLLIAPGVLIFIAWGVDLNIVAALVAVLIVVLARQSKLLRWLIAAIAALIVAVPPYPYWVFWSEQQGWHFHWFSGFTWENLPMLNFALVWAAALALFAAILWATKPRPTNVGT